MDTVLIKILEVIIGTLLTYAVGVLAKALPGIIKTVTMWIEAKVEEARSNFSAQQLAIFDSLVLECIQAVEQKVAVGQVIAITGAAKKALALDMIKAACARWNIPFDVDAADQKIEAAINQGFQESVAVMKAIETVNAVPKE